MCTAGETTAPVLTGGLAAVAACTDAAGSRATTVADPVTNANNVREILDPIKTRALPTTSSATEAGKR
jgi:hypothetical protein